MAVTEAKLDIGRTSASGQQLSSDDAAGDWCQQISGAPSRFDWSQRASSRSKGKAVEREQTADKPVAKRTRVQKRIAPPHPAVLPGDPYYHEILAYSKRFLKLLEAERQEDESIIKHRLSSWSMDRLKSSGYCLTGMTAYWLEKKPSHFGRPAAAFSLGPGLKLPEHKFDNGSQVLISRVDPLKEKPIIGSVLYSSDEQIHVSFEVDFPIDGEWRLDLGQSDIIYERLKAAVQALNHDPSKYELASDLHSEMILHGTHLRDILLQSFSPNSSPDHTPLQDPDDVAYVKHELLDHDSHLPDGVQSGHLRGAFDNDSRIRSWAMRMKDVKPVCVEGDPKLEGLNETQRRAVAMMIGNRISLVQGPPGTGKTKTIIEAVRLLKAHFEVPYPLLVCTYTNVAVDNLVEGLVTAGVKPIRVGYHSKVKDNLASYTLDYQFDNHPLRPTLDQLREDLIKVEKSVKELSEKIRHSKDERRLRTRVENMMMDMISKEKQLKILHGKSWSLRLQILKDIITAADVVCTTCVTSASRTLDIVDFPVVFVDEASMSTEPASLIPLMKGSRHVALIGDHKQLPPVITSKHAQEGGLGVSLFERLTKEGVVPSIMLDVQYRMHPSISRFPSTEFYHCALRDGTVDTLGAVQHLLSPPSSKHLPVNEITGNRPSVVFLDHAGSESMKERSRVNYDEADIVCTLIEELLLNNEKLTGQDIGIIAPYVAQISLFKRLLSGPAASYLPFFKSSLGDLRAMQLDDIEIKTVDGFEGREKDVIIFSTVRNNKVGSIGFLQDRRRLNVGLTRAKRGLFIVGSIETLKHGVGRKTVAGVKKSKGAESWHRYAQYLDEQGLVVKIDLPERFGVARTTNSRPKLLD